MNYIHMKDLDSLELLKTHYVYFEELLELPKERLREMRDFCMENKNFVARWKERNDFGYLCEYKQGYCAGNLGRIIRAAATLYFGD